MDVPPFRAQMSPAPEWRSPSGFVAPERAEFLWQQALAQMPAVPPPSRREVRMTWPLVEPPPNYDSALASHGMSPAKYIEITQNIAAQFATFYEPGCSDVCLDYLTLERHTYRDIAQRRIDDWARMTEHMRLLNVVWKPHGIVFNREFEGIAFNREFNRKGLVCIMQTFSQDCSEELRRLSAHEGAQLLAEKTLAHFNEGITREANTPSEGYNPYIYNAWTLDDVPPLYDPSLMCFGMSEADFEQACQELRALHKSLEVDVWCDNMANAFTCFLYGICYGVDRNDKTFVAIHNRCEELNTVWTKRGIKFTYVSTFRLYTLTSLTSLDKERLMHV